MVVLPRLSRFVLVLALIFSIGLHWTLLQPVAWLGMVVNFSQGSTLSEALSKTFDGQHPCKLCKLVSEGKKAERKQNVLKVETKLVFFMVAENATLYPPTAPALSFALPGPIPLLNFSPPTPPPKQLLG